ncbi:hypothetical protein CTEN210_08413 [Chaetoceros tenuissimus]|uniref:PiggyBac transposable element-derived protein domain-containing protein n=1 Tax=Chaetoceros tenuissimus TaxID=426638 RepID=A0AAD3CTS5_9STRA|nr:hypothetical protein CTEN210_03696 [Chaetoceros tenuissimus]GFH51937.1 hypothetical protein CTEN210_08413 [Chaetoceros tenuissimus]
MTFKITIGTKVTASIGRLENDVRPGNSRKVRASLEGFVASSLPGQKWLVFFPSVEKCVLLGARQMKRQDGSSSLSFAQLDHLSQTTESFPNSQSFSSWSDSQSSMSLPSLSGLRGTFSQPPSQPPSVGTFSQPPSVGTTVVTTTATATATTSVAASTSTALQRVMELNNSDEDSIEDTQESISILEQENEEEQEHERVPNPYTAEVEEDLIAECEDIDKYTAAQILYHSEKEQLLGQTVSCNNVEWTVCGDVKKTDVQMPVEYFKKLGILDFDFKKVPEKSDGKNNRINMLHLLMHLWPGDWKERLIVLNERICENNKQLKEKQRNAKTDQPISPYEFWCFFGIMLVARIEGLAGTQLWNSKRSEGWRKNVDLSMFMNESRFKSIKKWIPYLWTNENLKNSDPWYQIVDIFKDFNENRREKVLSSTDDTGDETMSAIRPRTTPKGNLPHLQNVLRKPEPLGTELKSLACTKLKMMKALELQRSANDRTETKFLQEVKNKKTSAVTLRLVDMSSQRGMFDEREELVNTNCTDGRMVADSWFGSVTTIVGLLTLLPHKKRGVMNIKTATSGYPKAFLEQKMEKWPGGSHLVLTATVNNIKLYAVGYKYSSKKTMCFIFPENTVSTEPGDPYIARYKDENGNNRTREVRRPECCSFYFQNSNVIDVLNQLRQHDLRLEKFWVTRDGYFRIITTVFGICVVDCWRGYRHHLSPRHRHKDIDLLDFVSILAHDMMHNKCTKTIAERGTLNIGIGDEIEKDNYDDDDDDDDETTLGSMRRVPRSVEISNEFEMSQLSSPSFQSFNDIQLLLLEHSLKKNEELTFGNEKKRMRSGQLKNVQRERPRRNRCVGCTTKRTAFYCAKCDPGQKRKKYWLCKSCHEIHLQQIQKDFAGGIETRRGKMQRI